MPTDQPSPTPDPWDTIAAALSDFSEVEYPCDPTLEEAPCAKCLGIFDRIRAVVAAMDAQHQQQVAALQEQLAWKTMQYENTLRLYDERVAAIARTRELEQQVAALTAHLDQCQQENTTLRVNHQWCPIETAPTDGTHVLVCDARRAYTASWGFAQNPPTVGHYFQQGWHLSVNRNGDESEIFPTHWMPLPEPPCAEDPS